MNENVRVQPHRGFVLVKSPTENRLIGALDYRGGKTVSFGSGITADLSHLAFTVAEGAFLDRRAVSHTALCIELPAAVTAIRLKPVPFPFNLIGELPPREKAAA